MIIYAEYSAYHSIRKQTSLHPEIQNILKQSLLKLHEQIFNVQTLGDYEHKQNCPYQCKISHSFTQNKANGGDQFMYG